MKRLPVPPLAIAKAAVPTGSADPHSSPVKAQGGTNAPVSFDFRDTDVRVVLKLLASASGAEVIATDEVNGRLTLKLDNVPWDEALDIIAHTMALNVERMGNLIRVTSAARAQAEEETRDRSEALQTDLFQLRFAHAAYVAELLTGERTHAVTPGGEADVQAYHELEVGDAIGSPRRAAPPANTPQPAFNRTSLLSPRGSAIADEPSNTLIVTDVQRGLVSARQVIEEIDRPAPQVEIESRIIETTHSLGRALGVQWGYRYAASAATGNPTGLNFPGSLVFGGATPAPGTTGVNSGIDPITGALIPFLADFPAPGLAAGNGSTLDLALGSINQSQLLDLRLSQLEDEGKIKIISRPRIITRNNEEAVIKSVDIARVRLPASTIFGYYSSRRLALATEKIEAGVMLRVKPQVSADGYIMLDLTAVSSSLLPTRTVDSIPIQEERATESHVLLRDGQTLVVGGIYRISTNVEVAGLPFLQSIPGLGWMFGGVSHEDNRQELLIFVTPRRVAIPGELDGGPLSPARQLWLNRTASGG